MHKIELHEDKSKRFIVYKALLCKVSIDDKEEDKNVQLIR